MGKNTIEALDESTVNAFFDKIIKSPTNSSIFLLAEPHYLMIRDESDRGAVITAAIIIENQLKKLLDGFLIPPATKKDKEVKLARNFQDKIHLCYRLGLIGKSTKELLDCFRDIRNKFAHNMDSAKLEDQRDYLVNGYKNTVLAEKIMKILDKGYSQGNDSLQKCSPVNFIQKYGDRPSFNILFSIACAKLEMNASEVKRLTPFLMQANPV